MLTVSKHEGDGDTYNSESSWNSLQTLQIEAGETKDQRKNRDHPDNSLVEISWNT